MTSRDALSDPSALPTGLSVRTAQALIEHAAHRAPAELAERLQEEWRADLMAQTGALGRLRFALGCLWARQVIALNPLEFGASASATLAGHGALAALTSPESARFSRRTTVLLFIIALHGLVFYAFASGIASKGLHLLPPPFVARFVELAPSAPLPLPQPRVQLTNFNHIESLAPPRFNLPPNQDAIDIRKLPPQSPQTHPELGRSIRRVAGGPGSDFPSTGDFYPPSSIRLGETGVAAVQVCVDAKGHLIEAPKIANSSGSARLDASALALAKAGSGHYRSATEDGKPVASCFPFGVRFALRV